MPSAKLPIVSFSARIESDLVSVEAGATVPIAIEVANKHEAAERFEIQIEGLDPEWTAVPVPVFPVNPGETASEKIFFKPPRASESLAGNYPFVVRIRAMESGEARTVQGVLEIKPFHHLSLELNPKRGSVSPWRSQNEFHATVMNLGNTEHTLQLYGNDPDEALVFEFEQEQVTVAPGQQRTIEVYVDPTSRRTFSSSRLYMFSISARSIEQPSIVTTSQAQLEQKPLLSPASILGIAFVVLILGLWIYMLPKPATVDRFSIEPGEVLQGEEVVLKWETSNAQKVRLKVTISPPEGAVTSTDIPQDFEPDSSYRYRASLPGRYTFELQAQSETTATVDRETRFVTATVPLPSPQPVIKSFTIEPMTVNKGDAFVINYEVTGATKIKLEPTGAELDLNGKEHELVAQRLGPITYTLRVENKDGKFVEKKRTITVIDPTLPNVASFEIAPKTLPLDGGAVTISWQLVNTVRQEIQIGDQKQDVAATGSLKDVSLGATTTITIRGWDAKGRPVQKVAKVVLQDPPPAPDPTTGGDTTSTTGIVPTNTGGG